MEIITKNEKETIALAQNMAKNFKGGEVIGLIGNLGAGKTIFAKGLAKGVGVKDIVNSPTFVLMKVYPINQKQIKNFVHIDAYRLNNYQELSAIGIEDYLFDSESVVVIEWADKFKMKKIKLIQLINKEKNIRLIKY